MIEGNPYRTANLRKPETELVDRWGDGNEPGWWTLWMACSLVPLVASAVLLLGFLVWSFLAWRVPDIRPSLAYFFLRFVLLCLVSFFAAIRVSQRCVEKKP